MKLYVSDIEESYKDKIIGNMENSGTLDLLLHIIQCWRECEVNEEIWYLTMLLYCSHMMYKYYSYLGFPPNQTKRGRKIYPQCNIIQYTTFHQKLSAR